MVKLDRIDAINESLAIVQGVIEALWSELNGGIELSFNPKGALVYLALENIEKVDKLTNEWWEEYFAEKEAGKVKGVRKDHGHDLPERKDLLD